MGLEGEGKVNEAQELQDIGAAIAADMDIETRSSAYLSDCEKIKPVHGHVRPNEALLSLEELYV